MGISNSNLVYGLVYLADSGNSALDLLNPAVVQQAGSGRFFTEGGVVNDDTV